LYSSGYLNAGIQVATRFGGNCANQIGADGEKLYPVTSPRFLKATDADDCTIKVNDVEYACKMNGMATDLQKRIIEKLADDYLAAFRSYGANPADSILQLPSVYDELWAFRGTRNENFFEGFGQSEFLGEVSIFEQKGLRTSNTNGGTYYAFEKSYRESRGTVKGMSFPATPGVSPETSPFAANLLEEYRDATNDSNQPIIYSGGFNHMSPWDQRYIIGLARLKVENVSGRLPSALLWAYNWDDYQLTINDPDYVSVSGYKNTTARYVAKRDHLAWGTKEYVTRFGLRQPPLFSKQAVTDVYATGDETVAWSGIIEGVHDLRIAKAKRVSVDTLPWAISQNRNHSVCLIDQLLSQKSEDDFTCN